MSRAILKRRITGYHLDEYDDWVAELDCYHGQHVRNNPPFINRPWVETEAGRNSKLGELLDCVRCDRLELPDGLSVCETTPKYSEKTMPVVPGKNHVLSPGIWGIIHLLEGSLIYIVKNADTRKYELKQGETGIIAPNMQYQLEASGSVAFYLEYLTKNLSVVSS